MKGATRRSPQFPVAKVAMRSGRHSCAGKREEDARKRRADLSGSENAAVNHEASEWR